jgi:hypothetical protein
VLQIILAAQIRMRPYWWFRVKIFVTDKNIVSNNNLLLAQLGCFKMENTNMRGIKT